MSQASRIAALFLCACFCAGNAVAAEPLGLVTGPKTGTYFAVGKDIAKAARTSHIIIDVKPSEGSVDNIKRINSSENASLGIVQSDVLGFLARSKSPDSLRMAGVLRMIFPLYKEEVHVLARGNIKNFTDLQGKRVAIGEEGSGNMLTAINLFSMMRISPDQSMRMSPEEGVVAVLRGELDAAIFVGGKPVRMFKNMEELGLPENGKFAAMLQQVHFVPLDDPRMLAEYRSAVITHADYGFVTSAVPTIAVQAVLVTYDLSRDKRRCETVHTLATSLRAALPGLQVSGHPKWKEVNFDADPGLWKKDSCAWPPSKKEKHKKPARKRRRKHPVVDDES